MSCIGCLVYVYSEEEDKEGEGGREGLVPLAWFFLGNIGT